MKQIHGIYLPDHDTHFESQLSADHMYKGKATYQHHKYRAALPFIKRFDHAVDIGAHVGLWTRVLADDFTRVTAFEPLSAHLECFHMNVGRGNVTLLPYALGNREEVVGVAMPINNTGNSHIHSVGQRAQMKRLDDLSIDIIDFLKIDVEGYEYEVLMGAEQIIRRSKPTVIIEQKPRNAERFGRRQHDASKLLESWGMKTVSVVSGDHIMVF